MDLSPDLELLRSLVKAHEVVHPNTGGREPIMYLQHMGGSHIQHHGFGDGGAPDVDETAIEDLHSQGLIEIDYRQNSWLLMPSLAGRQVIEDIERASNTEASADVDELLEALEFQVCSENKLAWPAVRPVLMALRRYWEASGFPATGIGLPPLFAAIPEGTEGRFSATVRSFVTNGYLDGAAAIRVHDLPAFVTFTDRAFAVLDGWPGASDQELVNNLLAVLAERAENEPDVEKKKRFERLGETVRELGVSTAGEVLAKVLTGG